MTRSLLALGALLALPASAQPPLPVLYTIENPDPLPTGGLFGSSFQAIGDVDLDGVGDLLVGAVRNTAGAFSGGRAYVFSGASGALVYSLASPLATNGGQFGASVTGLGDLDGDGTPDLAVGAPGEPQGQVPGVGRVHVFSGRSGAFLRSLDSPAPNTNGDDQFGASVVGVEDVDGDGVPDVLVAAARAFYRGSYPGKLYAFSGADGGLVYTVDPEPVGDRPRRFGPLLSLSADSVFVVTNAVRFEVLDPASGEFSLSVELAQGLGNAYDVAGDVDGDGVPDLFLGRPTFDPDGRDPERGRVLLYSVGTGEVVRTYDPPIIEGDRVRFGNLLSTVGDADGDGFPDFAAREYTSTPSDPYGDPLIHLVSGATGQLIGTVDREAPQGRGDVLRPVGDVNRDGVPDFALNGAYDSSLRIAVVSGAPLPVATDPEAEAGLALAVSPNPVRGTATVRFEGASPGAVRVSVFDALGREVAVVSEGPSAGPVRATFDAGRLPAGVYVVRLVAGASVTSRPFVVVR